MNRIDETYSGRSTVKNTWYFLFGKGFSALCTLGLLGAVVRFLPIEEYSIYISSIATIETGIALSLFGLDWAIIRYVPQYYIAGDHNGIKRFIFSITALRFGSLLTFSCIAFFAISFSEFSLFTDRPRAIFLIAAIFLSEGILRLLRDNTLESLANQAMAQLTIVLRQGTFLATVVAMGKFNLSSTVESVLFAELGSSILAAFFASISVYRSVQSIKNRKCLPNWQPPSVSEIRNTAWNNYFGSLLSYPYSLQALVLLAASIIGANAAAPFGFVVRIVEILRGYLPSFLLMNVLRPRLFAIFEKTNDFERANSETRLISRLSFFTIFPLIVLTAQHGDLFIELASGGRINDGGNLLLVLFISLAFRVQRQTATLLINCVKLSAILIRNAFYSLLALPIFLLVFYTYKNLTILGFAILADELIWVYFSAYFLQQKLFNWSPDILFIGKLALASSIFFTGIHALSLQNNLSGISTSFVILTIMYALYSITFKPFGNDLKNLMSLMPSRISRFIK